VFFFHPPNFSTDTETVDILRMRAAVTVSSTLARQGAGKCVAYIDFSKMEK
jgi:hypothetical protein